VSIATVNGQAERLRDSVGRLDADDVEAAFDRRD